MGRNIKHAVLSGIIAIILECLICFTYSYFYLRAGNAALQFSISRVIAMLVIYWGIKGLGYFQKTPDYGI